MPSVENMLKKGLLPAMFGIACAVNSVYASPQNLSGNTGVYYDKDLHGNYILSDPSSSPANRWAVFYGPQPRNKTAYIETVLESRAYQGDFEKQTGAIERKTVTIGTITGYQNGKGKLKVSYVKTYLYDKDRAILSSQRLKNQENKTYLLQVADDEHFTLTLPDGSTQHYEFEGADIGGYDDDMAAYLKKRKR
ncbi:MAG: hypothetical protein IKI30_01210 [Oxalobacter sp.]|nr:hypothetical protein [Oxalobacter sp.]